jgi:hypothetical protein
MKRYLNGAAVWAGIILITVICFLVPAIIITLLWNAIMPDLFGLKTIGYGQALGLMVLGNLIFNIGIGRGGR